MLHLLAHAQSPLGEHSCLTVPARLSVLDVSWKDALQQIEAFWTLPVGPAFSSLAGHLHSTQVGPVGCIQQDPINLHLARPVPVLSGLCILCI